MHEIVEHLKKNAVQSRALIKSIIKYDELTKNPIEHVYQLEKQREIILKKTQEFIDGAIKTNLITWLEAEQQRIEQYKEEFRLQFGRNLNARFKEQGFTIRGQYPILRVHLFTLKVDFEFGQASIFYGPEVEKLEGKVPLQTDTIYRTIMKYVEALRSRVLTTDSDLNVLEEAYRRTVRIQSKEMGDKVLITDLLREFVMLQQAKKFFLDPQKRNYKEFTRMELSYILYSMKQAHFSDHGWHLHVATFDATTDKRNSFWIPENESGEGTHYSHIALTTKPDTGDR